MAMDLSRLPPERQQEILNGPALRPPPGITSNFDDPPNHNAIPYAVIPICLLLTTVCIFLRAYARIFISKRIAVDDVLSWIGFGTYIYYLYAVYHVTITVGFFVHQWDATFQTAEDVQGILQIAATCYNITLALVKSAILLQWIRLFAPEGIRGAFYWVCQTLLWINLLFYLATTTAGNLLCVPYRRIYDKTTPGYCFNGRPLNLTIGAFNLASDICILILPQRIIWHLRVSFKRKLGIALTFAVGLLACAAAAMRLGFTVGYLTNPDWLYHVADLSMSCIAEMTCILLVYNMPGIPMVFRESPFFSKLLSSLSSSRRPLLRLGKSTSTGTSGQAAKEKDNQAAYAMSLNEYHEPASAPSEHTLSSSTEQLRREPTRNDASHMSPV